MSSRGFADLSPPEARHAILELPTNRADYVGMLKDMGDYPRRSPIGQRIPDEHEVDALNKAAGRWRVVVLLDDARALTTAATLFSHEFVLDPMYDSGAMLYAAWHDPLIRDEHSRRLAEQAGLLVRAAPLLNATTAILAPDHLPGSWTPRPGWRKPRSTDNHRQHAAWAMRSGLVLLYWADRLNALVCATQSEVIAALDVLLGERVASCSVEVDEPVRIDEAQALREAALVELSAAWSTAHGLARRRARVHLDHLAETLGAMAREEPRRRAWRLSLGAPSVPEPSLLIRRILNGEDPERDPPLTRRKLRRRPMALLPLE
jgi:hypothetical protein